MIDKDTVKRSLARSDGQECIDQLVDITNKLLAGGILSMTDIIKQGGWCKSVNYKGSVFFIYTGKMTRANKIYYDAAKDLLTDTDEKLIELHTKPRARQHRMNKGSMKNGCRSSDMAEQQAF